MAKPASAREYVCELSDCGGAWAALRGRRGVPRPGAGGRLRAGARARARRPGPSARRARPPRRARSRVGPRPLDVPDVRGRDRGGGRGGRAFGARARRGPRGEPGKARRRPPAPRRAGPADGPRRGAAAARPPAGSARRGHARRRDAGEAHRRVLEALALLPPGRRPFLFVGGAVAADDPLHRFVASRGLAGDVAFGAT